MHYNQIVVRLIPFFCMRIRLLVVLICNVSCYQTSAVAQKVEVGVLKFPALEPLLPTIHSLSPSVPLSTRPPALPSHFL